VYKGLVPMSPKTTPMAATARVNTSGFLSFAEADLIKVLIGRISAGNRDARACDGSPAMPACDSWFRFFRPPGTGRLGAIGYHRLTIFKAGREEAGPCCGATFYTPERAVTKQAISSKA